MHSSTVSLNQRRRVTDRKPIKGLVLFNLERTFAFMLIVLMSPLYVFNMLMATAQGKSLLESKSGKDCMGNTFTLHRFSTGFLREFALTWSVLCGQLKFCGMPMSLDLEDSQKRNLQTYRHIRTGYFNLVQIQRASGLASMSVDQTLITQFNGGAFYQFSLLLRALFNRFFYSRAGDQLNTPEEFDLFGLKIHNHSLNEAVEWALSRNYSASPAMPCQTGCFINVNSINLIAEHKDLKTAIKQTNRCFADGAGIRLAAKTVGINVKENVNGTDMLMPLCASALEKGHSIYFMGSKPGVAKSAADNLLKQFPELKVAGEQHGYFDESESQEIIDAINASKADILLIAMGSPMQEKWLVANASKLNCGTAMAVGGLFDFYSGNIPRAPLWMREIGMEWVWRLLQEPKTKFRRYVIGNPLFLIQIYLFNRARKGW